jgi:hypothetical protein
MVYHSGPRERAPWPRERRPWLFHPCEDMMMCHSCDDVQTLGAAWSGWSKAPFGEVPRQPKPTLWIRPPAGPIPSWSHQHTSWVLSSLSDCEACVPGWVLCPCAMGRGPCGAPNGHTTQDISKRHETSPDHAGAPMVVLEHAMRVFVGSPGRQAAKVAVGDGNPIDCEHPCELQPTCPACTVPSRYDQFVSRFVPGGTNRVRALKADRDTAPAVRSSKRVTKSTQIRNGMYGTGFFFAASGR